MEVGVILYYMPSRNITKLYDAPAYYHVYNRGIEKRSIFLDDEDYSVFLALLKRYIGSEPVKDNKGREYKWLASQLEVIAFCLMPNHFHLFLFQSDPQAMPYLLKAVQGTYSVYFNKKYDRTGVLFESVYKAVLVRNEAHFQHITRYIHRNPQNYLTWKWSSLDAYLSIRSFDWIHPERSIAPGKAASLQYEKFLRDTKDYKQSIDDASIQFADS